MSFTESNIAEASLSPSFDDNALEILRYRYLAKDEAGTIIETPDEMFTRVARYIARAEHDKQDVWEQRFRTVMRSLDFLPSSPILFNAGVEPCALASCFVLRIEDSMESIFDTLRRTAIIQKSGGGTGFSFSNLREKGAIVGKYHGVASGAVSFMGLYNRASDVVKQGGRRRGANMGVLRVDHPEIHDFIWCKHGNDNFSNFNISVALTDAFLKAVTRGDDYDLIGHRGRVVSSVSARQVFDEIAECSWGSGEPGILFIDRINEKHPLTGVIDATNPCGEQPLLPNESCVLGSVNLANCVNDGDVNYERLADAVQLGVRFLDDAIDVSDFIFPEIEAMTKSTRKIGLGVMGWADFLVKMGVPYGSKASIDLAESVMRVVNSEALSASRALALTRGVFPAMSQLKKGFPSDTRNASRTTIAPTGSIANIAMVNFGIEPFYALTYTRLLGDGRRLTYLNPLFERVARERGFWSKSLETRVCKTGTVKGLIDVPQDVQELFATAYDLEPQQHVEMLAAFQKYTDNAVSKTVNLPASSTVEDVKRVLLLADSLKCKGLTIYRNGSRDVQVLTPGTKKPKHPLEYLVKPKVEACSLDGGCG